MLLACRAGLLDTELAVRPRDDGPSGRAHRLTEASLAGDELSALLVGFQPALGEFEREEGQELASLEAAAEHIFGSPHAHGGTEWVRGSRLLEQLEGRLEAEVAETSSGAVAAWASEASARLSRASPAALLVTCEALQLMLPIEPRMRRAKALGIELAANEALGVRPDFDEGLACNSECRLPMWEHETFAAAAADPAVQKILDDVRRALPIDAGRQNYVDRRAPPSGGRQLP